METPAGSEITQERSLAEQILEKLKESPGREKIDEIRKQKQLVIIGNLSPNFENELIAKGVGFGFNETQLSGEIFEELVRADRDICQVSETEIARLLRTAMSEPARFKLRDFGINNPVINPDIAQIDEDTGKITGVIEVKAGSIGNHGRKQLANVTSSINQFLQKIEVLDAKQLKDHGLDKIANYSNKLELSEYFRIILARPFGMSAPRDIKRNVKIVNSQFSKEDLGLVAKTVFNWLEKQRAIPNGEINKV